MNTDIKSIYCAAVQRLFNDGELAQADALYAPSFVEHGPAGQVVARGPEEVKRLVLIYRRAFPDLTSRIETSIVEGQTIATRWVMTGTHLGPLEGIPATKRKISMRGMTMTVMRDRQAIESWNSYDVSSVARQLIMTRKPAAVGLDG